MRPQPRLVGVRGERHPAGQHVEEHRAERVDVGAHADLLAADLLGGDVVHGAQQPAGAAVVEAAEPHAEPEVGQVDVAPRVEQDVGGLDVAVDEAARVRGVERRGHLGDDRRRALGLEPAFAAQHGAQVLALDVAHDLEQHAVLLARVMDRDHVRMVERRGDLRLRHEAAAEGRVIRERGRDQLDGHVPVEREVGRPVDHAHASLARHLVEAVAREDRPEGGIVHMRVLLPAAAAGKARCEALTPGGDA